MGLGRDVSLAQLRPHYHAVVLVSDSPIYILHTFLLCVFVCLSLCVCDGCCVLARHMVLKMTEYWEYLERLINEPQFSVS